MYLISAALRRPLTVMVIILAIALGAFLAVGGSVCQQLGIPYPAGLPKGMEVDIFPSLNLPVIYVCQPYGGMDPAQMEGFLTNYYEYHFLYISGIHHVESRNVQGMALMKLYFHPGTDMAQAMAETINYVNRSQAFMPPGTVSPFVMRFDTGSVPVGYLVLSSDTRSIAEIQDLALFRVRPMFSTLPGVSAPPPFGGSARTVVVTLDPQRLQSYAMSPDEVITALVRGNSISPSGNIPVGDKFPIVPVNSVVREVGQLGTIPIRTGESPVFIRDVGTIQDAADAPAGYALANGRRAVYILATKRSDASTLSVINNIKSALPKMKDALGKEGEGIDVRFEFDQSPYVTRAVAGVATEGLLGAVLVGVMILLFLRDWRSALVVVLNIPLALMTSVLALWLTGQTINLMTLGGLALAIGILVDEATVAIENIHAHLQRGQPLAQAVLDGSAETSVPRFLAMRASWPCLCRRSSCRGRPVRCSCRYRLRSDSRCSPPIFCRARSCPCFASGCSGTSTATRPSAHPASSTGCAGTMKNCSRKSSDFAGRWWAHISRGPCCSLSLRGCSWDAVFFPWWTLASSVCECAPPTARISHVPSSMPSRLSSSLTRKSAPKTST